MGRHLWLPEGDPPDRTHPVGSLEACHRSIPLRDAGCWAQVRAHPLTPATCPAEPETKPRGHAQKQAPEVQERAQSNSQKEPRSPAHACASGLLGHDVGLWGSLPSFQVALLQDPP